MYSTPLAKKQHEFEMLVKSLEIARAGHIARVFYGVSVGFWYVLIMGFFIGYDTFKGGTMLSGWLFTMALGFLVVGRVVRVAAEKTRPSIEKAEKFLEMR